MSNYYRQDEPGSIKDLLEQPGTQVLREVFAEPPEAEEREKELLDVKTLIKPMRKFSAAIRITADELQRGLGGVQEHLRRPGHDLALTVERAVMDDLLEIKAEARPMSSAEEVAYRAEMTGRLRPPREDFRDVLRSLSVTDKDEEDDDPRIPSEEAECMEAAVKTALKFPSEQELLDAMSRPSTFERDAAKRGHVLLREHALAHEFGTGPLVDTGILCHSIGRDFTV